MKNPKHMTDSQLSHWLIKTETSARNALYAGAAYDGSKMGEYRNRWEALAEEVLERGLVPEGRELMPIEEYSFGDATA